HVAPAFLKCVDSEHLYLVAVFADGRPKMEVPHSGTADRRIRKIRHQYQDTHLESELRAAGSHRSMIFKRAISAARNITGLPESAYRTGGRVENQSDIQGFESIISAIRAAIFSQLHCRSRQE